LLVAAGAAACASGSRHTSAAAVSSASGSPQQSPQVDTFSPYAATGTLAVPVADQTPGTCWTGSIAVPIATAYRCIAGNQIYDPCFAPPGAATVHSVACIADPWSKAHVVTVTGKLPKTTSAPDLRPFWALQLANGAHCVAVTGTVAHIDGVDLDYACGSSGDGAGIVVDDDQHLVVGYGPEAGPHLTRVPVQVAWRV
jgi:hypothetical protein